MKRSLYKNNKKISKFIFAIACVSVLAFSAGGVHAATATTNSTTPVTPATDSSGAVLAPSDAQASQAYTQAGNQIVSDRANLQALQDKYFEEGGDSNTSTAAKIDKAQINVYQQDIAYQQAIQSANNQDGGSSTLASCVTGGGCGKTQAEVVADASLVNSAKVKLEAAQSELLTAEGKTGAASALAASAQQTSTVAAAQAAGSSSLEGSACSLTNGLTGLVGCVTGAIASIALLLLGLVGFLLGFVGAFFNWVVVLTVFRFGDYFGNSSGLLLAWGILRDIGNIALLAAFIWFGILIILDINSGATRKAIPTLIIAALLLNFSLFAAEAVIDISDVLSAAMYNQAGQSGTSCETSGVAACANTGISAQVLSAAGLNNIFSSGGSVVTAVKNINSDPTHQMIVYVGLIIFVTVTMAVLLSAAIMLIIRSIVLVLIMILAPLGFAAMAIPMTASLGKRWRDLLLSQSFFAPVYILLLLVSLKVISAVSTALLAGSQGKTLFDALNAPTTSTPSIIIVFALITGFMIAAQMSAKQMGAVGASWATNAANKTARWAALSPVRIGGGWAYRHSLAPGFEGTRTGYNSLVGNLRARGGLVGGLAGIVDHGIGGGINSALVAGRDVKVAGAKSYTEKKTADKHRDEITSHAQTNSSNIAAVRKGLRSGATDDDKHKMQQALQKMSDGDLAEFAGKISSADREILGANLSTDKLKKMLALGDDKFDHDKKHDLTHGRWHIASDYAKAGNYKGFTEATKDYSVDEWQIIAENDPSMMTNALRLRNPDDKGFNAPGIKDSVLTELKKKGSTTPTQQRDIDANRRVGQVKSLYKDATYSALNANEKEKISKTVRSMSVNEYAELSNDELLKDESIPGYSKARLQKLMSKDDPLEGGAATQYLLKIKAHHDAIPPVGSAQYLAATPEVRAEYDKDHANFEGIVRFTQKGAGNSHYGDVLQPARPPRTVPAQPPAPPTPPTNTAAQYFQGGGNP